MKPGYRTSEFWLTLVSVIVSGAVGLGFLPAEEGNQLGDGLSMIIVGVFLVIPVVAYNWSRATVKAATVEALSNANPEQTAQIEAM